jgi:hypothetical protein
VLCCVLYCVLCVLWYCGLLWGVVVGCCGGVLWWGVVVVCCGVLCGGEIMFKYTPPA